jgi:hypothetical protein
MPSVAYYNPPRTKEATERWLSTHLNGGRPLEYVTAMIDEPAQGSA